MVTEAQWSQWTAYRKLPSFFRMVRSMTSYNLHSPKIGGQMHPPGPTSRRVLPPGKCDRRVMSPFAKLLWPLLLLITPMHTRGFDVGTPTKHEWRFNAVGRICWLQPHNIIILLPPDGRLYAWDNSIVGLISLQQCRAFPRLPQLSSHTQLTAIHY